MGNVSGVANDWEQVEFGGELLEDSAGGAFPVLFLKLISRFELAELPVPNRLVKYESMVKNPSASNDGALPTALTSVIHVKDCTVEFGPLATMVRLQNKA